MNATVITLDVNGASRQIDIEPDTLARFMPSVQRLAGVAAA